MLEFRLLLIDPHCGSNGTLTCLNIVLNLWAFHLWFTLFLDLLSLSTQLLQLSPHGHNREPGAPVSPSPSRRHNRDATFLSSSASTFVQGLLTYTGREFDKTKASLKITPIAGCSEQWQLLETTQCVCDAWDRQRAKPFPLPKSVPKKHGSWCLTLSPWCTPTPVPAGPQWQHMGWEQPGEPPR